DEPAVDRSALDSELATATHKAAAAAEAIADLDGLIEIANIRVARLQEAERSFVNDELAEVADDLVKLLARKRGEAAALEKMLDPLRRYGIALRALPEKNDSGGIPLRARIGFNNRTGRQASMRWGSRIQRIYVSG